MGEKAISFTLEKIEARRIYDALWCCISREETRYYLNGVCLESGSEGLLAVATDGHRLGRLKLNPRESDLPKFKVILPRSFIVGLGGMRGQVVRVNWDADEDDEPEREERLTGDCTITIDGSWIHYRDQDTGFCSKLIDGTFPEWRKVIPDDVAKLEPLAAFNCNYLAEIAKALSATHGHPVGVALRIGDKASPAIFETHRNEIDLTYVLMPMRF